MVSLFRLTISIQLKRVAYFSFSLPAKPIAATAKFYEHIDKDNKFLGIRMAAIFDLAQQFKQMPPAEIKKLLNSEYYEQRMGAVSIMDFQARDKKVPDSRKKELY